MSTEFYTDDILAQNFTALDRFGKDVVDTLQSLTTLAERTEMRLQVLEKVSSRPMVVKTSKVFLLTVVGLSVYAGYKYAQQRLTDETEYEKSRSDHPAGKKSNGQDPSRTHEN